MHASARMMIGLLLLAPVAASAKSDYAACLAEQGKHRAQLGMGSAGGTFYRRASIGYAGYAYIGSSSGYYNYSSMIAWRPVYSSLDGQADRLMAMVRNCRQYKEKSVPPNFRVVGIKSPARNIAGNREAQASQ